MTVGRLTNAPHRASSPAAAARAPATARRAGSGRWTALILAAGLMASQASARTAPDTWKDPTLGAGGLTGGLLDRKSAGFYDPVVVIAHGRVRVLTGQAGYERFPVDTTLFDTDYDCDKLPEVELNRAVFSSNYLASYLKAAKTGRPRAKIWLRPEDDPADWLKEKAACGF
jgi:hypothetical protein